MAIQALYTAASGIIAGQTGINVIANNMSNSKSTSYKAQKVETSDAFYQYQQKAGANGSNTIIPLGIYTGAGTVVQGVSRLLTQGPLQQTEIDTNVAIMGKGFFKIELPDGTLAYTRAGNFQRNADGQIVTLEGYTVSPGINIPQNSTNLTIDEDGTISVSIPGNVQPAEIGQFDLVDFINPSGLEVIGNNLYLETESSGGPVEGTAKVDGFGYFKQGFIEGSNVEYATQLINLVEFQRNIESLSKIMHAISEELQTINQINS